MEQLGLFGGEAPAPSREATRAASAPIAPCPPVAEVSALAAALPRWLRLGTSSWSFPGWGPHLVYGDEAASTKDLAERGLAAYAQHPLLRTVGVDRTYYAPMRREEWAAYRAQVGEDFVPIAKVWSGVTAAVGRDGVRNGDFLDPARFLETMWEPAMAGGFDARMPFVFEIPPMRPQVEPPARFFLERLERLLAALPREGRFTFELRTKGWLTPEYVRLLAAHGASHTINYWSFMPGLLRQWRLARPACGGFLVVRLMLPPGARYEEQKASFAPFDREAHAQPAMHDELGAILDELRGVGAPPEVFVIANNKAEGSAPITCRRVAERFVARGAAAAGNGAPWGAEGRR
jgi:uncharacterized protein YecE (DUF72 family)